MTLPLLSREKSTAEAAPLVVFAERDACVPKFVLDSAEGNNWNLIAPATARHRTSLSYRLLCNGLYFCSTSSLQKAIIARHHVCVGVGANCAAQISQAHQVISRTWCRQILTNYTQT